GGEGLPPTAALFASSSVCFFFCCFAMSSGLLALVNAIVLPSGDQRGGPAPFGRSVKVQASPPFIDSMASCGGSGLPSFSVALMKTRNFPSGDHSGELSCGPLVNRCGGSLSAVETVQIAVSYPSFFSFTLTRTKATRDPSGEICGSPIQTKSNRSFSVIPRLSAACDAIGMNERGANRIRRHKSLGSTRQRCRLRGDLERFFRMV